MSEDYTIKFSDGSKDPFIIRPFTSNGPQAPSTTVLDLTAVSANTPLILLGKGMNEYGNRIMNNFVYLLENFASPTPPSYPVEGQLWFDSASGQMKYRNGTWRVLASMNSSTDLNLSGYRITNVGTAVDPLDAVNLTTADARFVRKVGDSVLGQLNMLEEPSQVSHVTTKLYVDTVAQNIIGNVYQRTASDARYVAIAGGAMSGFLTLSGTPVLNMHAATKQYVDDVASGSVSTGGGSLTGELILSGDPVNPLGATPKQYVDGAVSGKLDLSGGVMTGLLELSGAPVSNMHAATKLYVDTGLDTKLNLSGGVMTGLLELSGAPVSNMHAATKLYVDGAVSGKLDLSGGVMTGALTTSVLCDGSALVVPVTEGDVVTIANNVGTVVLVGAPVAALTVELPNVPLDKQKVTVSFAVDVAALTLVGTVVGGIVTVSVGDYATWMFDSGTSVWYRVG